MVILSARYDIPRLGVDLAELNLVRSNGLTVSIENEESGTGSSLVNRPNENFRLLHGSVKRGGPNGLQELLRLPRQERSWLKQISHYERSHRLK